MCLLLQSVRTYKICPPALRLASPIPPLEPEDCRGRLTPQCHRLAREPIRQTNSHTPLIHANSQQRPSGFTHREEVQSYSRLKGTHTCRANESRNVCHNIVRPHTLTNPRIVMVHPLHAPITRHAVQGRPPLDNSLCANARCVGERGGKSQDDADCSPHGKCCGEGDVDRIGKEWCVEAPPCSEEASYVKGSKELVGCRAAVEAVAAGSDEGGGRPLDGNLDGRRPGPGRHCVRDESNNWFIGRWTA